MIEALRRQLSIYGAFSANAIKLHLAYSVWFWVEFAGQIIMMTIFVFFWRAVYASTDTVGGLGSAQTLSYILFAQMVAPLVRWSLILDFGFLIREGQIAIEMLRPVDLQLKSYVEWATMFTVTLARQTVPLGLVAWLFFGLRFPTDPRVWGAFAVSLLLGNVVLFAFDWAFGSLAFYLTEVWGLHVLREGVATFFSGALLPLTMLPGWLQKVAAFMPFGQSLNAPVALLTGITPLERAPQVWVTQAMWAVGLLVLSRVMFRFSVRKVTVQGG